MCVLLNQRAHALLSAVPRPNSKAQTGELLLACCCLPAFLDHAGPLIGRMMQHMHVQPQLAMVLLLAALCLVAVCQADCSTESSEHAGESTMLPLSE